MTLDVCRCRAVLACYAILTSIATMAGCSHPTPPTTLPAAATTTGATNPPSDSAKGNDWGVLVHRRRGVVSSREAFMVRTLKDGGVEVASEQRIEGAGEKGINRGYLRVDRDLRPISARFSSSNGYAGEVVTDSSGLLVITQSQDGKITRTDHEPARVDIYVAGFPSHLALTCRRAAPGVLLSTAGGRTAEWQASETVLIGARHITTRKGQLGDGRPITLVCEESRLLAILYPAFESTAIREGEEALVAKLTTNP